MTKLELMEMLKNVDDNAELTFVVSTLDRDGFPYDITARVYKVLGGEVVIVRGKYGITTYENLDDTIEYVEEVDKWGDKRTYYRKKEG
jgi:hypothetical protein